MTEETRTVNPTTGGEKGSKLERFDLIPVAPLTAIARHFGIGSHKYEDRNWERGYQWSLSFSAMQRHAWAFWGGEDTDPESGDLHLAAVAWHALALMEWATTHPEMDDRPTPTAAPAAEQLEFDIPRAQMWPSVTFNTTKEEQMEAAKQWVRERLHIETGS